MENTLFPEQPQVDQRMIALPPSPPEEKRRIITMLVMKTERAPRTDPSVRSGTIEKQCKPRREELHRASPGSGRVVSGPSLRQEQHLAVRRESEQTPLKIDEKQPTPGMRIAEWRRQDRPKDRRQEYGQRDIARNTRAIWLPAARATIICAMGARRPPLMPCSNNEIRSANLPDHARPHRVEIAVAAKHQRGTAPCADAVNEPSVERQDQG